MTPADFAPYREQFIACCCPTCREVAYALSNPLDGPLSPRHVSACTDLLAALKGGTHNPVTATQWAAECKQDREQRLAEAIRDGAPAVQIEALQRGYGVAKMSGDWAGVGVGPHV